jgi:phosphoribosylaminoimidazolecarboxamide formyltransferase / IMP cyclohydrolase
MPKLKKRYGSGELVQECLYGENKYQTPAGLYREESREHPLALHNFGQLEGTGLSYNNLADLDRLIQTIIRAKLVSESAGFYPEVTLGAKHGNCCGGSYHEDLSVTCEKAAQGDERALFGGVVLSSGIIGEAEAERLTTKSDGSKQLLDLVAAMAFTEPAVKVLQRKTGKCRLLENWRLGKADSYYIPEHPRRRPVVGGFLLQPEYSFVPDFNAPSVSITHRVEPQLERDLLFAWAIGSTSNSNTITLVQDGKLVGNGVGQQDRVGAAELAIKRARDAGHELRRFVAYSDSFFPFPDAPMRLIEAGAVAILTSKGSVRDSDTVKVCEENDVALYMMPDESSRGFFGH